MNPHARYQPRSAEITEIRRAQRGTSPSCARSPEITEEHPRAPEIRTARTHELSPACRAAARRPLRWHAGQHSGGRASLCGAAAAVLRPRRTQSLCLSVLTRDCKSRGRPSAHVDVRSRGHTEVRASRARVSRDSHVCEIPCDCHSCLWVRSLARQDDWAGKGRLGLHRAHRLRQKLFPAHYETRHRHRLAPTDG